MARRETTRRNDEARLIIALGSQGTAALAVMLKMLRAFVSKGILQPIELVAILDAAAEGAERTPDEFDGKYSRSVGAAIRLAIAEYLETPPSSPDRTH